MFQPSNDSNRTTFRTPSSVEGVAVVSVVPAVVVVSAPSKTADYMCVLGVNDDGLDPEKHKIVSNASCDATWFALRIELGEQSCTVGSRTSATKP